MKLGFSLLLNTYGSVIYIYPTLIMVSPSAQSTVHNSQSTVKHIHTHKIRTYARMSTGGRAPRPRQPRRSARLHQKRLRIAGTVLLFLLKTPLFTITQGLID